MAYNNSSNINVTGVLTSNGNGTFSGSSLTQYRVLLGGASNQIASTAVGTAGQVLVSNGAGFDPTYQSVPGGFIIDQGGISTNNAIIVSAGTGGIFVKNSNLTATDSGCVNNVTQAAFQYTASTQSNVTGDGTVYTLIFSNKVFDQANNFDGTSTFTYPSGTGGNARYYFGGIISITGITSSHTSLILNLVRPASTNQLLRLNPFNSYNATSGNFNKTFLYPKTPSGDATLQFSLQVSGGSKVISVTTKSLIFGYLIG